MRKEELDKIYKELSVKRKSQMPKYLQILKTYFPFAMQDKKERALENYAISSGLGREFAEEMLIDLLENSDDDIRDPKNAYTVSRLFHGYIYEGKAGLANKDKEFIVEFIELLSSFGTLDYAYNIGCEGDYIDSKMIYFRNEDVVITDPCYFVKDADWIRSDCGINLEVFGVDNYITRLTLYGDWSCTVYNLDENRKPIGEFCADAGLVSVISLKDITDKLNPDFEQWAKEHDWCVTIIRNYTGTVQIRTGYSNEPYVYIVGSGSINFTSEQTGF